MSSRPTLTVCITAFDAQERLGWMLAEAERYADEVIVAVDEASTDGTWDVARSGADRAFRFRHQGSPGLARLLALERARAEWTLFLDDDEGMDAAFPELRDELMRVPGITHWAFPVKWLTSLAPPRYLRADPWWPDHQIRMAVGDSTRVWKPAAVHTGLLVMGPRGIESRTALMHYQLLDRTEPERRKRIAHYLKRGQTPAQDRFYAPPRRAPRAPVDPPPLRDPRAACRQPRRSIVEETVEDLGARPQVPGWGAEVSVQMPDRARRGQVLFAEGWARNTGSLRWGVSTHGAWPALSLSYRIRTPNGELLPDQAPRAPVGRDVLPGEATHFLTRVDAPLEPGRYVLAWQLVSEFEYWFEDLGSAPALIPLEVRR